MAEYIKSVEVKEAQLEEIKERIIADYGKSILISWKMKRELGFVIRYHEAWIKHGKDELTNRAGGYYKDQIFLDFYSESLKTAFMLRYM